MFASGGGVGGGAKVSYPPKGETFLSCVVTLCRVIVVVQPQLVILFKTYDAINAKLLTLFFHSFCNAFRIKYFALFLCVLYYLDY